MGGWTGMCIGQANKTYNRIMRELPMVICRILQIHLLW